MPCFHPLRAWRLVGGSLSLKEPLDESKKEELLRLPCGGCLGCRMSRSREWALRCELELKSHPAACWVTLTYDDEHLPPTLQKLHVRAFLKRLRSRFEARKIRFFASGEYGETFGRPHYHCILFGLSQSDVQVECEPRPHPLISGVTIPSVWPFGFVRVDPLSPAAIAYVAGYSAKKIGFKLNREERIDERTGELYTWEPPFVVMSRKPGIGADAGVYRNSWRKSAIYNGSEIAVPRYLHNFWKRGATPEEIEELRQQRRENPRDVTKERLIAAEKIALQRFNTQSQRRKYG